MSLFAFCCLGTRDAASFVNNQSAGFVIGQNSFLRSGTNGGAGLGARSIQNSRSLWTDGTKLVVSDNNNNRVLIYNSLPTSSDAAADVVVGQANMVANSANQGGAAAANTLSGPTGVYSDGTKLYIVDSTNNRVLIFNTIPTTNNASANVVVGQANMTSGSSNQGGAVAANTLAGPVSVYTVGTKLLVADSGNRRVLIYNTIPTSNNASANVAVGQANKTSGSNNQGGAVGANTLGFLSDIYSDGTKLFITDRGNHRVLIFNTIPAADNASADVAVGQSNKTSGSANQGGARGANTLNSPTSVYSDGTRLFVSDGGNSRVLIFNTVPSADNASANVVVGQVNMTLGSANQGGSVGANTLNTPKTVFSQGTKLFIADEFNHRFLIFNAIPSANNTSADAAVGQSALTVNGTNASVGTDLQKGINNPYGMWSDGTRLFVADTNNHRVLIYNSLPTSTYPAPDVVVGQANMTSNSANQGGAAGASTLNSPTGGYSDGTKLFIADRDNKRVLIFNTIPTSNNASANVVVGQANMTSGSANQGGAVAANGMDNPVDAFVSGTKLYITDSNNNRVLIFNSIPTSNNASADVVVGQSNMTSGSANQGGAVGANTLQAPISVFTDGTKLYVTDYSNHRVLIFNTIPTSNNASANVVLGQANMTSNSANQGGAVGANTLNSPSFSNSDGTKLYVTDYSNNRILVFNTIPTSSNASADVVLGQTNMTSNSANQGGPAADNTLSGPSVAFLSSGKLWVDDYSNHRILVFSSQSPAAPGSFAGAAQGVSSIAWSWANVANEEGFRVVNSTDGSISGNLAVDAVSFTEPNLSTNTAYARRVVAYTGAGMSTSAAVTRYTLAAVPSSFKFNSVSISSLAVSFSTNTNPSGTTYRLERWTAGSSTTTVTLSTDNATVTGLNNSTTFFFRISAINGDTAYTVGAELSTVTKPAQSLDSSGGSLTYIAAAGSVTVTIPPGTFDVPVTLAVSVPTSFAAPNSDLQAVGVGVELTPSNDAQPTKAVTLALGYRDSDITGFDESKLVLARYDPSVNAWVKLFSTPDPQSNTVSALVRHFSIFQIMQSVPASNLDAVRVIPNPLRPSKGHAAMGFFNLPANARVRIYTATGLLVRDLTASAAGLVAWDGTNASGARVSSGVYQVLAQGAGKTKTITVAVQR